MPASNARRLTRAVRYAVAACAAAGLLSGCSQSSALAHESFAPDSGGPTPSSAGAGSDPSATTLPIGVVADSGAPTRTSLAGPAIATLAGTRVTFRAVVTASSGSATPTGTVSFVDGKKVFATATLAAGHGPVAAVVVVPLIAGQHVIVARYNGDDSEASSSSAPITVTSASAATAVALVVKPKANHPGRFRLAIDVLGPKPGPAAAGVVTITLDGRVYHARLDVQGHTFIDVVASRGRTHTVRVLYPGSSVLTAGGVVRTFRG